MTYCTLDLKLINITGDDAKDFLQGQLTADLNALEENKAIFCGHCNLKGRLVSLGYLFKSACERSVERTGFLKKLPAFPSSLGSGNLLFRMCITARATSAIPGSRTPSA